MNKPLWSGRFNTEVDPLTKKYTRSLHVDRRLAAYDLWGSRAHVRMLAAQGILSQEQCAAILKGLSQIEEEIRAGRFPFREDLEDIHMNVEQRLQELVGEAGSRIHTGRSRNDQVALDLKLFCRDAAHLWQLGLIRVEESILDRAQELRGEMFAAWTHLQAAQPLSWGHYLLAFAEMFGRDFQRLAFFRELHCDSPLGAGALAGSTLNLDPEFTAREVGLPVGFANSYDVVGNRDFVLELLQIATQIMLHVSRLAEDFIYFSSTAVGWIELPDPLCTGSSMMPQKKNPDLLELSRGKTASVLGHASAVASLLKGLPSSYHRDLQQDKEHLFPVFEIVKDTLEMLPVLLSGFRIREERARAALKEGYLLATDLAEYLVLKGVPFRTAHERVGRLVNYCIENGCGFEDLSLQKMRELIPELDEKAAEILKTENVLERRRHKGSTGVASVEQQISSWNQRIQKQHLLLSQQKLVVEEDFSFG
ncbi:MAG: argininosuccinate lyase [Acidobacteria bacterium]|nr:argininosuccinate lyase [Acidobacteriota bacterium]